MYTKMLPPNRCSFDEVAELFDWPACECELQRHHVLSRSKLMQVKKAIALVEKKYRKIFMRWVCAGHNCSKYADTRKGRAWLLAQFPSPVVRQVLEEVQACYKGGYPDISYDALMTGFSQDRFLGMIMGDAWGRAITGEFYDE